MQIMVIEIYFTILRDKGEDKVVHSEPKLSNSIFSY